MATVEKRVLNILNQNWQQNLFFTQELTSCRNHTTPNADGNGIYFYFRKMFTIEITCFTRFVGFT